MSKYTISQSGIDEIKRSEKLELKAYQDIKGVWTIGYGHTGKVGGKPIGSGMTITEEQAEQILTDDIKQFENTINTNVKVPLNQGQYDALVSLAFNIGGGNFKGSTLLRKLNEGDYQTAADQMLVWNKSGGKFVQGLLNRRKREREMFLGVGEGKAPNIPIPTGVEEHYYDNRLLEPQPQLTPDTLLQAFNPTQPSIAGQNTEATPPLAPLAGQANQRNSWDNDNDLVNAFEQLNGTHTAFSEPEPPKRDNSQYDKQLAEAFGIAPSTKGLIPDYIGEMIKSIYDQTA